MQLTCPKCGTREIRVSAHQGFGETVKSLWGVTQLRCRRCRTRWETSVWSDSAWRFARCPKCYRQHLTTWSLQYYRPPTMVKWKLGLGATPYRCAACRHNFASFLPCKEKFAWRHQTHANQGSSSEAPAADTPGEPGGAADTSKDLRALSRAVAANSGSVTAGHRADSRNELSEPLL